MKMYTTISLNITLSKRNCLNNMQNVLVPETNSCFENCRKHVSHKAVLTQLNYI